MKNLDFLVMTLNNSIDIPMRSCAIPATDKTMCPLTVELRRLFIDGYDGIGNNPNATLAQVQELVDCEHCSEIQSSNAWCINGDEWAKVVDKTLFGRLKRSVDTIVSIKTRNGVDKLLLVEGKLGCVVNVFTGKNIHPQWRVLFVKYHRTKRRIGNRFPSCNYLVVIASQDSLAQMRRRIRSYVSAGQLPPTEVLCTHEFCVKLAIQDSYGAVSCGMSAVRHH